MTYMNAFNSGIAIVATPSATINDPAATRFRPARADSLAEPSPVMIMAGMVPRPKATIR